MLEPKISFVATDKKVIVTFYKFNWMQKGFKKFLNNGQNQR
jgi:hypothetical protein